MSDPERQLEQALNRCLFPCAPVPIQCRRRSLVDPGTRPRDPESLSPAALPPRQRGFPERRASATGMAARQAAGSRARSVLVPGARHCAPCRITRAAAARSADSNRGSLPGVRRPRASSGRRGRGARMAARGKRAADGGRARAVSRRLSAGAGGRAGSAGIAGGIRRLGGGLRVECGAGDPPPAGVAVRCPRMRCRARRGESRPGCWLPSTTWPVTVSTRRSWEGAFARIERERRELHDPRFPLPLKLIARVLPAALYGGEPAAALDVSAPLAALRDEIRSRSGRGGVRASVPAGQSESGVGDGDSRPCGKPAPRSARSRCAPSWPTGRRASRRDGTSSSAPARCAAARRPPPGSRRCRGSVLTKSAPRAFARS